MAKPVFVIQEWEQIYSFIVWKFLVILSIYVLWPLNICENSYRVVSVETSHFWKFAEPIPYPQRVFLSNCNLRPLQGNSTFLWDTNVQPLVLVSDFKVFLAERYESSGSWREVRA